MKAINTSVRTNLFFLGVPNRSKAVAALKKSAHKKERAQLKLVLLHELDTEAIAQKEDRMEAKRLQAEAVYNTMILRVMDKKRARRQKVERASHEVKKELRWEPNFYERAQARLAIETFASNGQRVVIASCALLEVDFI